MIGAMLLLQFMLIIWFFAIVAPIEQQVAASMDARMGLGYRGYFKMLFNQSKFTDMTWLKVFGATLLLTAPTFLAPNIELNHTIGWFLLMFSAGLLFYKFESDETLDSETKWHTGQTRSLLALAVIFVGMIGVCALSSSVSFDSLAEFEEHTWSGTLFFESIFSPGIFLSLLVAGVALFGIRPFSGQPERELDRAFSGLMFFQWCMVLSSIFFGFGPRGDNSGADGYVDSLWCIELVIKASVLFFAAKLANRFIPRVSFESEARILSLWLLPFAFICVVGAMALQVLVSLGANG